MAYLKKRTGSKVWSICYLDENGARTQKTTGYRWDDDRANKLAHALEAEMTRREHLRGTASDKEVWAAWVTEFLARHVKGRSHERYTAAWVELYNFLREKGVVRPRDLTYQHALDFLTWRTAQKRRSGKPIRLNTALNDMKVLRVIMRQAVRLGYATGNPCDRLGVAKEEVDEKPEFSDADIAEIREKLANKPEWMRLSFEIALNTGCRVSETQIAFRDIDFTRKTITFAKPKGGKARAFTIPLPKNLVPLLTKKHKGGAEKTLTLPPMSGKLWWEFFSEHFPEKKFCFHCTRVTFITRLARAGVPINAAMRLVNHASVPIHRIYQRHKVEDVRRYSGAAKIPIAAD